jgi:hypothetical protein
MLTRSTLEAEYAAQCEAFARSRSFQSLAEGIGSRQAYDQFIAGVCRTHLKSPQILAFLYSVAPPNAAATIRHNMLEELGLEGEGVSHPALLLQLMERAGFSPKARRELDAEAQEHLRRMCTDPILFGTFKEVGLCVLLEVTCFEWMLAQLSGQMARFLGLHRRLAGEALQWFEHHSEVDKRHADEGLETVMEYLDYYEFEAAHATSILEITLRENPFLKRYFGQCLLAAHSLAA